MYICMWYVVYVRCWMYIYMGIVIASLDVV